MTDTRVAFDELTLVATQDASDPPAAKGEVTEVTEEEAKEAAELLAKTGLDHVPTIEEAKALLAARRAEIRHAVMVEADKRDWCEDGTRKVCANLRLERPGSRTNREVEVEMTLKIKTVIAAYTEEGVARKLRDKQLLNEKWLRDHLYVNAAEATPLSMTIDGTTVDLALLTNKKPEVSA